VVIGRQNALSYADRASEHNRVLSNGDGLLRALLGGDHVLKKVITWAVVIFVIYYLATDPGGAASFLKSALHGLQDAGNSMSKFVNKL
jgi:hypothetical protein